MNLGMRRQPTCGYCHRPAHNHMGGTFWLCNICFEHAREVDEQHFTHECGNHHTLRDNGGDAGPSWDDAIRAIEDQ